MPDSSRSPVIQPPQEARQTQWAIRKTANHRSDGYTGRWEKTGRHLPVDEESLDEEFGHLAHLGASHRLHGDLRCLASHPQQRRRRTRPPRHPPCATPAEEEELLHGRSTVCLPRWRRVHRLRRRVAWCKRVKEGAAGWQAEAGLTSLDLATDCDKVTDDGLWSVSSFLPHDPCGGWQAVSACTRALLSLSTHSSLSQCAPRSITSLRRSHSHTQHRTPLACCATSHHRRARRRNRSEAHLGSANLLGTALWHPNCAHTARA